MSITLAPAGGASPGAGECRASRDKSIVADLLVMRSQFVVSPVTTKLIPASAALFSRATPVLLGCRALPDITAGKPRSAKVACRAGRSNRCGVLPTPLSIHNPKHSKGLNCHYTLGTGTSLTFLCSYPQWALSPQMTGELNFKAPQWGRSPGADRG